MISEKGRRVRVWWGVNMVRVLFVHVSVFVIVKEQLKKKNKQIT